MPLYEYECDQCGRFELIRKFSDAPLSKCPTCGGPVQKLLSSPAIQFKGTGWYVTDYAKKSGGDGAKGKDADTGSKDAAVSSAAGDSSAGSSKGKSESGKSEGGKSESGKGETPAKAAGSGGKKGS